MENHGLSALDSGTLISKHTIIYIEKELPVLNRFVHVQTRPLTTQEKIITNIKLSNVTNRDIHRVVVLLPRQILLKIGISNLNLNAVNHSQYTFSQYSMKRGAVVQPHQRYQDHSMV